MHFYIAPKHFWSERWVNTPPLIFFINFFLNIILWDTLPLYVTVAQDEKEKNLNLSNPRVYVPEKQESNFFFSILRHRFTVKSPTRTDAFWVKFADLCVGSLRRAFIIFLYREFLNFPYKLLRLCLRNMRVLTRQTFWSKFLV